MRRIKYTLLAFIFILSCSTPRVAQTTHPAQPVPAVKDTSTHTVTNNNSITKPEIKVYKDTSILVVQPEPVNYDKMNNQKLDTLLNKADYIITLQGRVIFLQDKVLAYADSMKEGRRKASGEAAKTKVAEITRVDAKMFNEMVDFFKKCFLYAVIVIVISQILSAYAVSFLKKTPSKA